MTLVILLVVLAILLGGGGLVVDGLGVLLWVALALLLIAAFTTVL